MVNKEVDIKTRENLNPIWISLMQMNLNVEMNFNVTSVKVKENIARKLNKSS